MKAFTIHSKIYTPLRNCFILFSYTFFLLLWSHQCIAQKKVTNAYAYSFLSLEGKPISLKQYDGRKICVIVFPDTLKVADSSFLNRMDSFAKIKSPSIQIIAIPSFAKNGTVSDGGKIMNKWYQSMVNHGIVFSNPMNIDKARRSEREDFLTWLTNSSQNGSFDKLLTGEGAMFLIDEKGKLKGAFDRSVFWNDQLINIIFNN